MKKSSLKSRLNGIRKSRGVKSNNLKAELVFEDKQDALEFIVDGMDSLMRSINSLVSADKICSDASKNVGKLIKEVVASLQNNLVELQKCYSYMSGKQPDDVEEVSEEVLEEESSCKEVKSCGECKNENNKCKDDEKHREYSEIQNRLDKFLELDFGEQNVKSNNPSDDEVDLVYNPEALDKETEEDYENRMNQLSDDLDQIQRTYGYEDDEENREYSKLKSRLSKYMEKAYSDDNTADEFPIIFPETLINGLDKTFPKVSLELLKNDTKTLTLGIYEDDNYDAQLIIDHIDASILDFDMKLEYTIKIIDKKTNEEFFSETVVFKDLNANALFASAEEILLGIEERNEEEK